jgi:hypothetical protein
MNFSLLKRSDIVGFAGAVILLGSLFLPWFGTSETNTFSQLAGASGGETRNAFQVYGVLDWLLVAACSAPFILAYIIARGHALGWRPGEVTAIVGLTAFVLIFCNGIVFGKPGEPNSEISFEIGYLIGLIGAAGIAASGFVRQLEGTRRKPPGV